MRSTSTHQGRLLRSLPLALLLLAAAVPTCGSGGDAGLKPPDPDTYQRLLTCLPPCLARVFAQEGCTPMGACQSASGSLCYANGVKVSIARNMTTSVTTTTIRGVAGAVCYVLDSAPAAGGASATSTFKSATGAVVATVKHAPADSSQWSVTCDGKTQDVDTNQSPCSEALKISGGGCMAGTCP